MSEVYIPNNIDGLIIDLTELVAKARADAIEECIEIIKGTARRNCSHLLDEIVYRAVEQMEQLKEKKV